MMAPEGGMEAVVQKLRASLDAEIRFDSKITDLSTLPNLVLAVPAHTLSEMLSEQDPPSALALQSIRYAPLITCTVFIHESAFSKHSPRGVGVLIPRGEGLRILGVLFNSSAFPGRSLKVGFQSFTVMLGGTEDPSVLSLSDPELTEIINQDLDLLFNLKAPPAHLHVTRWTGAIPVYSKELSGAREALAQGFCSKPGRVVFNNYSKEVSIRGLIQSLNGL